MSNMNSTLNLYELRKLQTNFPNEKITTADEAAKFIRQFYSDDIDIWESFFILLLNNAGRTIGYAKISQGGITGTVADIRIIAKYAVDSLATSIILAHNHPSGNLKPSQADINLTQKAKKGLDILDITVLDHIILTSDSHYSFADQGML